MIIFHKYYLFNLINNTINNINSKDFSLLCISCFLLGTKSSDILIRIDDILECIYKNNFLKIENNLEYHKKIIFNYEYDILESLGFDLGTYNFTYKYISYIFDIINNIIKIESDATKLKKMKEYLIAQIRYSFTLPFFLKYNFPTIILSNIIIILRQLSKNFEIEVLISELNKNKEIYEEITRIDIDNFINLFEFFLMPKKNKDVVINKNEINENKTINMDAVRKINFANVDNIKDCSLNLFNDNNKMKNV